MRLSVCYILVSCQINSSKKDVSIEPKVIPLFGSEPFRLIDQFSTAHTLAKYKNKRSIFLTYITGECFHLNEKNILLNLPKRENSESLLISNNVYEKYEQYEHLFTPVLFDDFQFVTKAYDLTKVGSFVEISTENSSIISRGQIKFPGNELNECQKKINYETPSFSKAKEAFAKQCIRCHMQNINIDYFTSMSSIQKWSAMMSKTMETFRMPPGGVDAKLKYKTKGLLSREELVPLYKWLASGAPNDKEDEKNLQEIRSTLEDKNLSNKFKNRKPDLVLKMKKKDIVPAQGNDYLEYSLLGGPFLEDTFFEAAQFEHNREAIHHSFIYINKNKKLVNSKAMVQSFYEEGQNIEAFLNNEKSIGKVIGSNLIFSNGGQGGSKISYFGKHTGIFVPKGYYLTIENHYHPNGYPQANQSVISFYKYQEKEPLVEIKRITISITKFSLQPNQSNLVIHSIYPIKKSIKLFSILPHLHMRGKEIKIFVKNKKNKMEMLLSVPFYLYKHQTSLAFENPVQIEKGSEIHFYVSYDNSISNIGNPDSSKLILRGLNIFDDEMHSLILAYTEQE
ncbi:MAG: hypothetical protein WA160_05470 [Pseudobdellovibrio sp.]